MSLVAVPVHHSLLKIFYEHNSAPRLQFLDKSRFEPSAPSLSRTVLTRGRACTAFVERIELQPSSELRKKERGCGCRGAVLAPRTLREV